MFRLTDHRLRISLTTVDQFSEGIGANTHAAGVDSDELGLIQFALDHLAPKRVSNALTAGESSPTFPSNRKTLGLNGLKFHDRSSMASHDW